MVGSRHMDRARRLGSRAAGAAVTLASVVVLGALLTATIYWTLFDPRWTVFLGGVLFAATIAAASRMSTTEWKLMRRTQQLVRARAGLDEAAKRARAATDALRMSDERMRLLCEALPQPVFFVDREARCHFHNAPAAALARRPREAIDRVPLQETLGGEAFDLMRPHLDAALAGRWAGHPLPLGGQTYAVRHVPFPQNDPQPTGVFLIFSAAQAERAEPPPLRAVADSTAPKDEDEDEDEPRAKLARALKDNEFLLLAQPIVALSPDAAGAACCEVLLRLKEEEQNLLPPGGFFPLAERCGMMEALDRWVVRDLIAHCAETGSGSAPRKAGLYCVNLSEAALRSAAFGPFVQTQILKRPLLGGALCFEIAERDIARRRGDVARLIDLLKPLGCRFTADNMGAGESLDILAGLDFDFVKIDGTLIQNMVRRPAEMDKVLAIAARCRDTGMRTIAAFVEDKATLDALLRIGIDYAQGFGVAGPAPLRAGEPVAAQPEEQAQWICSNF